MNKNARERASMKTYEDLLTRADGPPGSAWGLFGADDEMGSAARLTPAHAKDALKSVRSGRTIGLDYPVGAFDPPPAPTRKTAAHQIFSRHPDQRDDFVDHLYLQSSTHIDGLRHRRHGEHGFYNGFSDELMTEGSPTLGVNRWAKNGLVGRGVLVDVARHFERQGRELDCRAGEAFDVGVLDATMMETGLESQPGDMVVVRTGFCRHYFDRLTDDERRQLPGGARSPGLRQSEESLRWIWDHELSLLAADNIAVEVSPPVKDSPFQSPHDGGKMHPQLIALLGLVVGELWALEELSQACEERGQYDFMLVVKPLNVIGGVGAPANAVAIL